MASKDQSLSIMILPLALAGFALSACAFREGPTPAEQKATALEKQLDANSPLVEDDFKTKFIPGSQRDEYSLRVSWPAGRQLSIRIDSGIEIATYDGRTQSSALVPCVGKEVDFKIETFNDPKKVLSRYSIKKTCPKDLIVIGQNTPAKDLNEATGRIVIEDNALISLGAEALNINAMSIEVKGKATIRTFNPDTSFKSDSKDKFAAREIIINAERASGQLKFELNGIDGAPVPDRPDFYDSALKGRDGDAGELRLHTFEADVGGGRETSYRSECLREPTNGQRGRDAVVQQNDGTFKAIVGEKGISANPGLGTSNVTLNIADVSELSVSIDFNPGRASQPGKGALAKGGRGGAPGANPVRPAKYEVGSVCVGAQPGANGLDGLRGPVGDTAVDGKCGQISIPAALVPRVQMRDLNLSCSKEAGIIRPM